MVSQEMAQQTAGGMAYTINQPLLQRFQVDVFLVLGVDIVAVRGLKDEVQ